MSSFYHQDERDYAVGYGCLIVIVSLFLFAVTVAILLASF